MCIKEFGESCNKWWLADEAVPELLQIRLFVFFRKFDVSAEAPIVDDEEMSRVNCNCWANKAWNAETEEFVVFNCVKHIGGLRCCAAK